MSTPPLSKRARELQQSENGAPFRSPSLSPSLTPSQIFTPDPPLPTVHETDSLLASPPGLSRRPRAGTLPSAFYLDSSSSNPALRHLSNGLLPPPSMNGTTSLPVSGSTTPSEFNFNSSLLSSSRLRSGSLTLPSSGLSNAFGPNVWSGGWGSPATRSPGQSGLSTETKAGGDDLRSPESSTYGDDSHVRTLDYLGLDGDSPVGGFGPFSEDSGRGGSRSAVGALGMHSSSSFGNLRSINDVFQAQHGRMRSNTVATFPRTSEPYLRSALPSPFAPSRVSEANEEYFGDGTSSSYHRSLDSTDSTRLLYSTGNPDDERDTLGDVQRIRSNNSPSRARAATIGILDESREVFMRRRAGTATGMTPHAISMGSGAVGSALGLDAGSEYPGGAASVMARGMRGLSISQDEMPGWSSSRPLTPEAVSLTPPLQQPTRSLWIGNLDPKTSPGELQAVFAPYGAIESLRLIPEKECGFVNFVSTSDAVRAKEDVLNRLGGQLMKARGMVRIGFGKMDTAPSTPSTGLHHSRIVSGGSPLLNAPELNVQTSPTRALWVGSIPASTTPNHLLAIFSPFGPIESARVLTHKSCGFINYERLDDAISARKALNGREILGTEVGSVRIGYAKVPTKSDNTPFPSHSPPLNGIGSVPATYNALNQIAGASGIPLDRQLGGEGGLQDYRSNLVVGLVTNGQYASAHALQATAGGANGQAFDGAEVMLETVHATVSEMQLLMRELGGDAREVEAHAQAVTAPRPPVTYYSTIPQHALADPSLSRRYANADAPRLREIRKRLDSTISVEVVDSIALDLVDEAVALSSDYIGNTLMQKIFERASLVGRMALLERIAPHLAVIGTHKNGTWAVQKIIQCVQEQDEFDLIQRNLQPYTPALLLNDFGNYVVQGAMRFRSPVSDFIFDAMVDRCWEIGSGRFGARSTRQTLESPLADRFQVKRVAIAIILNSITLASSSNGALLITWLLDTSNLAGRYRLLAPRFAPHLANLCTHKLASLAVLKIINQRFDPMASRILLDELFGADSKVLEEVLGDQMHGIACISKVLGSTLLEPKDRTMMADRVRAVLVSLRVQSVPAYRKLVEDLGLPFLGPPAQPQPYQQPPSFQYQHHAGAPPVSQWSPYPVYNYPPPSYGMGYAPYPPQQFSQAGPAYPYYTAQPNTATTQTQARGNPSPDQGPVPLPYSTSYSPLMPPTGLPNFGSAPSAPFSFSGNGAFRPQYADSPGGHLRPEAGAFGGYAPGNVPAPSS